jgi:hypothetical protein
MPTEALHPVHGAKLEVALQRLSDDAATIGRLQTQAAEAAAACAAHARAAAEARASADALSAEKVELRCAHFTASADFNAASVARLCALHMWHGPLDSPIVSKCLGPYRQRAAAAEGFAASFRRRLAAHAAEPELVACSDTNMQVRRWSSRARSVSAHRRPRLSCST